MFSLSANIFLNCIFLCYAQNFENFTNFALATSNYFGYKSVIILTNNEDIDIDINQFSSSLISISILTELNELNANESAIFIYKNEDEIWSHYQYWQTWYVPKSLPIPDDLTLRLDSQLYIYDFLDDGLIGIDEFYAIKKIQYQQNVGFWNGISNEMNVSQFSLYERRSDLRGVLLNVRIFVIN